MEFRLAPEIDTLDLSEKGVTVPILSLTTGLPIEDGGVAVTFTVKGSDSEAFQEAQLEMERQRNRVLGAGGKFSANEAVADLLCRVTLGWTGIFDRDGKPWPFTPDNAKKLYLGAPAIRDQIGARVNNRANFTKASSAN